MRQLMRRDNLPAAASLVSGEVQVVAADGVSLAYPGTYGLHGCDSHDSGLEPSCNSTGYPGWCEHEWCYVDPTACNTEYSTTAYVVGATLHYSYRACGFSNEFESCLVSGEVQVVAADGVSLAYPGTYGLHGCDSHDSGLEPSCNSTGYPGWCEHEWCYVDPTACNTEYSTTAYVVGATLHYSYRACGFSNEFESCLVSGEVQVVAADGVSLAYPGTYGLHGCDSHDSGLEPSCNSTGYPGWCEHEWCYVDPTACNTEYSTTAYVVGATLHYSYRACGFSNEFESCLVSGEVQIVAADGVSLAYPGTYGLHGCDSHDSGLEPSCNSTGYPGWCEHEWCYVDPTACNTEYSTTAYVVGATLHYSYRACGFSNEFESCLVSGEVQVVAADGVSLAYPGTYGLHGCDSHDSGLEPSCNSTGYPGWCEHEWCYVDPTACNTEYSTTAYVVGATLHYSYRACGFSNEFESWSSRRTA
ncbi:hypothetical protein EMIHUDRAFT_253638 [Emiliania huxleyi CCMP1516]|uniref:Kringle domain-containing protein n=2 Tax=Emiliania huxleyi TaxID=2903 RepID=A0A0D3K4S6_EMIH1|nr:hypothetical protein EMIHUDRAFT_253638 [Emiliania huxleyi CCMP1516]EOD30761.1 hypothetical protein EMIHUDRAFT_253638 [Emiliania huxleyi CCMP1516]|eukprot:XP_005783190.1 hypothetical protein EMIHUDRAFT_253638 [Emiliania huxleyi CCMP1516]